jgi:hypothetical protein
MAEITKFLQYYKVRTCAVAIRRSLGLVALVAVQAAGAQPTTVTLGEPTCATCRIVVEPVVTLQTPDGDAGSPWATVRTRAGQFVIAAHDRIYLFAANGQYIRTIGRSGQGPGEYRLINYARVFGDQLHLFDAAHRRQTVLAPDWSVLRLNQFSGMPAWDALVVSESLSVVNGRITTREGAGHLLHAQDHSGRIIHSFGETQGGYRADVSPNVHVRRLAKTSSGDIWAAHRTRYQIDQWSVDGQLRRTIVRNATWFPPHLDQRTRTPEPNHPPQPHVMAVREDDQERLWILIQVADTGWAGAVRSAETLIRPEGRSTLLVQDRAYDSVVEVIDLRTGALLASRRFDQFLSAFVAEDLVRWVHWNSDDTTVAHLWRLRLER